MISLGSLIFLFFWYWILFLNHTDINEIGIEYNSMNGKVSVQSEPGWYLTSPLTRVAYISTLPMKVTIPSEARVIMTKIVRFKPEGVKEYIRLQGFSYQLNPSLSNTLMGYAFSNGTYPFLEIMQESNEESVDSLRPIDIIHK